MGIFHFKRFDVANEKSAMKVNTDGVLLGAIASIPGGHECLNDSRNASRNDCQNESPKASRPLQILDAGTGTGTIALMIAQRLENRADYHITGIDIDGASAIEADNNFINSPWQDRLEAINTSIQELAGQFDIIVSNPPYYDESLQNPDDRKSLARHTASQENEGSEGSPMSYRILLEYASEHLSPDGHLSIILPADNENALLRYGRTCGLFPFRIMRIRTTASKKYSRIVAEFARTQKETIEETLTIHESNGYSKEYQAIMKDFYLWA